MNYQFYQYAVARPLPLENVSITGGYWKPLIDQSRNVGLPRVLDEYERRNIVKNFIAVAEGKPRDENYNGRNYDEFLFKALEAAAYHLASEGTEELREQYERIRDIVISAQQSDGYLNTEAISNNRERFTSECHQEMYAGGHLMQAGIAEWYALGETTLFNAARRHIDRLITAYTDEGREMPRFRGGKWKWPDHPNLEMALVELYRVTGEEKYLDFCRMILDFSEYRERTQMLHHAVQELLHTTGGTDYYLETGEDAFWSATARLYQDMLRKVYITGAVGAIHRGELVEAVGKPYHLTNEGAYAETCASISNVFWNWRMFLITGERQYIDMLENALYNGVQAGIARNGYEYFYVNPHEHRSVDVEGSISCNEGGIKSWHKGPEGRQEEWPCSCCPPNVQRLFASLQEYIYAASGNTVWVNLFVNSCLRHELANGQQVTINQETQYPWKEDVSFSLHLSARSQFTLKLRLPQWCRNASIKLNGQDVSANIGNDGYVAFEREWQDSDVVTMHLPMPARLFASHPENVANYGKVVLTRGPLVYCLEQVDNPDADIFRVELDKDTEWQTRYEPDFLGGVVTLEGKAWLRDDTEWEEQPYQAIDERPAPSLSPVQVKAIPYYAWANRGNHSMVMALPLASKQ